MPKSLWGPDAHRCTLSGTGAPNRQALHGLGWGSRVPAHSSNGLPRGVCIQLHLCERHTCPPLIRMELHAHPSLTWNHPFPLPPIADRPSRECLSPIALEGSCSAHLSIPPGSLLGSSLKGAHLEDQGDLGPSPGKAPSAPSWLDEDK